jgi:hypothetical protein
MSWSTSLVNSANLRRTFSAEAIASFTFDGFLAVVT